VIYFDHAASSWPKPDSVIQTMSEFLRKNGANPGRGNHQMAREAEEAIYRTRKGIARLLNIQDPNQVQFFMNTTQALNQAIKGLLISGDHVITTILEHNSVRRPLEYLRETIGIEITYVSPNQDGIVESATIEKSIRSNTRLIAISHGSNVLGTVQPISEIGSIAQENDILFLVDAAQTAGRVTIDVAKDNIHLLTFPGHKALLGPQGIGGLYINSELQLNPLIHGGTGSNSESIHQPLDSPERYESGTLNTVGIVGLGAGIDCIEEYGIQALRDKEWQLTYFLLSELEKIPDIICYGPKKESKRLPVITFNIKGLDPNEVAMILDNHYQIAVRSGYHCAPLIHQNCSNNTGGVRISLGHTNTLDEVSILISALKEIITYLK